MFTRYSTPLLCTALAALSMRAPAQVGAQSLAQRVRNAPDGIVELRYAARPGVCGDGSHYFSTGSSFRMGQFNNGDNAPCLPGPVRVRMQVEHGSAHVVRVDVGPVPRSVAGATDLGVVPASAAADYFLDLASGDALESNARAITAAVLADSASVWRRLLAIARDSASRPRAARHEATFWLAQFAGAKLEGQSESLDVPDDGGDRDDPRVSAIFALSQLRNREGVDPLLAVARTNHDTRIRRKALFWLGESGDPRALGLFAEIMTR